MSAQDCSLAPPAKSKLQVIEELCGCLGRLEECSAAGGGGGQHTHSPSNLRIRCLRVQDHMGEIMNLFYCFTS